MGHPDDYTALSNWMTHNEVRDSEITSLVLLLADYGLRVSEIEDLMKSALRRRLSEFEDNGNGQPPGGINGPDGLPPRHSAKAGWVDANGEFRTTADFPTPAVSKDIEGDDDYDDGHSVGPQV